MKPLTYLTALQKGLQPNTLVPDDPITLPPIGDPAAAASSAARPAAATRDEGLLDAAQRRLQFRRRLHDAAWAGEFGQRGDRASARWRHRPRSGTKSRRCLRHRGRGENLHRLRALLSVRARRAAGAHDQSRRVLRRRRQRRRAAAAARHRFDRSPAAAPSMHIRTHRCPRSGPPTARRSTSSRPCCRAWWRAAPQPRHRRAVALCRGQDRHDRGCGRRLVHRLHQRRDRRGMGRLRQRRRQAPLARRKRDRRAGGAADLRAHHPGGVGRRHRAEGAAQRALRPRRSFIWSTCRSIMHQRQAGTDGGRAISSSISGLATTAGSTKPSTRLVPQETSVGLRRGGRLGRSPAAKATGPVRTRRRRPASPMAGPSIRLRAGSCIRCRPQQPSFFNQVFPRGLFTPRSQSDDPRNAVREQPDICRTGASTEPSRQRKNCECGCGTRSRLSACWGRCPAAFAQDFRIEDSPSARNLDFAQLKPG